MRIAVYRPVGTSASVTVEADIIELVYESSSDLGALLAVHGDWPAVLVTGGLSTADQEVIAAAIRQHAVRAVEVRAQRWDGFSESPLSAACRGVIAGFGTEGVAAAISVQRLL